MYTTLYRITTTHIGASAPSEYYYDTQAEAEANLRGRNNGEIDKVVIDSDYPLNYSSGCTMNDLTYGNFDVAIINKIGA